jgi:hypothetical protein
MPLLDETGYVPTEKYARAKELLKHAEMIGRRYGLYPKTLFQTEAKSLHWDESSALWTTKTNRGDNIRSRFVIPAAGPLHRPKLPGMVCPDQKDVLILTRHRLTPSPSSLVLSYIRVIVSIQVGLITTIQVATLMED